MFCERAEYGLSISVSIQLAHRRHFDDFSRKPPEFFSGLLEVRESTA
jgi:hypothetical protein